MTGGVRFTVPGQPVGWKRTRGAGSRRFTDAAHRAYAEAVGWAAKAAGARPVDGPVVLEVEAVHGSGPRPDLDNVCKLVADALQGVAYGDDRQVVSLSAAWVEGDEPGLTVTVGAAGEVAA